MRRYSKLLIVREMQIKTTITYHFTLVRMTMIKKFTNHKCYRGCGGKGNVLHCLWDSKLAKPLWEMIWRFFKKLKIAILFLGTYTNKTVI